ncbi:efflux RND transporter periplasmic adaptor subunit [Variovorax sp. JS1663]|uniref:efflux RND transporter periplasmic adaptor subunit n=1 Tax=Variovorax sp. JS1663 TaxID=1851577 RepID=UPI000B70BE72|nr:efflux RND transporter periplasmic adaptor subunit [Variovorax sp. JS1663]OUM00434.1 efflux transporter periplasmic adaptor subunit [Variovorax sp. JS1663]
MKTSISLLAVVLLGAVGAGGYWLGGRSQGTPSALMQATGDAGSASAAKPRKLLYYRNPMGLADTSPTPKKDPMGMDYVPVYEGEDDDARRAPAGANQIRIGTEKVQKLGVRTEAATMRALGKVVRAAGRIEPDERRVYAISPKFEGYVERLFVNVTGQPVSKGQALFDVYSPELVSAQREYAIAMQGVRAMNEAGGDAVGGMKQLAEASLARLRNWDLSPEQVAALVKTGEAQRTVTFRSPVSGIVTEKKALQGMRFMPGEALYQVTDLSSVWVVADVFEHDIGLVKTGAEATVKVDAYPGKVFSGKITYVYPTLKPETRTVPVRIELPNPGQLLKPAMFAQMGLAVGGQSKVIVVPDSAVIDSGTRQLVLVQANEGRFEPREVKLGARSDNYIEVRDGAREGEQVVVAANFLIDAESNLKAAIGGLGSHAGHGSHAKTDAPATPAPAPVGHKSEGTVDGIDAKAGTVSLNHGAIASLKWPAMTMDFKVANAGLLHGLKPGAAVAFEFVERQPGDWVVTAIKPAANAHSGR